jgi:uncharacterized protein YggE
MKRFLFLLVLSLPIHVFADGGLPDKPYIYVVGKAEIEKPADMMTLRFDLVGRAPEQPKANEDVQTKANKIVALTKDRKIAETDVIAEEIQSQPEFEGGDEYSDKRGKLIGFKVTRRFQNQAARSDSISKARGRPDQYRRRRILWNRGGSR